MVCFQRKNKFINNRKKMSTELLTMSGSYCYFLMTGKSVHRQNCSKSCFSSQKLIIWSISLISVYLQLGNISSFVWQIFTETLLCSRHSIRALGCGMSKKVYSFPDNKSKNADIFKLATIAYLVKRKHQAEWEDRTNIRI